jgi:hypothetical protein
MATPSADGAAAGDRPLASCARTALAAPYRTATPPATPPSAGVTAAAALEVPAKLPVQLKSPTVLSALLMDAGKKALNAGAAGGVAMTANVAALMWLRTTIQFQYRRGCVLRAACARRAGRVCAPALLRA